MKIKKLFQQSTYWLGVIAVGLVVGMSLQFVQAWTEPTVDPPGGNVEAPLNISSEGQIKKGGLVIRNVPATPLSPNGLIVRYGNVGIGTASPRAKLHVVHDTDTWGGILIGETGVNNEEFYIGHYGGPGSGTQLSQEGNLPIRIFTNGSERMRINGNGNVGIGMTDPSEKLDVSGNIKASGTICDSNGCIGGGGDIYVNESGFSGDPPNNDSYANFCPAGYKRITCQNWREAPISVDGVKVSFKPAFTDAYPRLYSPGGCAMSYCGPDNSYTCTSRITCIKE